MKKYVVAVVGATGLVGRKMLQVLEEHGFPVGEILLLASARSAGKTVTFAGKHEPVHELTPDSFAGVAIALFSAGATVSREYAPHAVRAGTLVVDNSSAFRLKPLHDLWGIRRIVVSTYQSVTGAGKKGLTQLEDEIAQRPAGEKKFPHQIAFNVLPQVDVFLDDGSSKEEYKMVEETKKIMGDDTIRVTATCVRVPVWGGHSESVNVEFEKPCDVAAARAALAAAPGVIVRDDPGRSEYPMPVDVWDTDPVYVGRIRRDPTVRSGLNLWIVADNLRKGAATNAVQIAEEWIKGQ